MWFLGPLESVPQTASRSVQLLLHSSPVYATHTNTQTTLHATSVAIGSIYICTACRRCGLTIRNWNKYRRWRGLTVNHGYPHMPILRPLPARRFVRFSGSRGAKFPQTGDFLTRTPMNHRAKFNAASFIFAGEIRNRTKLQNYNNNKKQTVNDISTPCLSIGMCG